MAEHSPDRPVPENQGEIVGDWVNAPADSHVDSFRLIDKAQSEFGAHSDIMVRFKSTGKSHKPPATYRYRFHDHAQAQAVFDALTSSDHPGQVIHQQLIVPKIPYTRIS